MSESMSVIPDEMAPPVEEDALRSKSPESIHQSMSQNLFYNLFHNLFCRPFWIIYFLCQELESPIKGVNKDCYGSIVLATH
jgi:hypothetical protein